MNKRILLAATVALLGWVLADGKAAAQPVEKAKPRVEVVFCLDTTGSMGGLINAAKQKIWSISNQIAGGNPTPELKIGLIAYRDRGDAYVTKLFDLTDNLDEIYTHLMDLKAQGGGDTPESVNQALHEAVNKISWTKDKKALKIIFLVGDAPPKFYADDVPFKQTCQLAVKNDIIINTIQCGKMVETTKIWKEISHSAEGSYVQIDAQGGPVVVIATPFDKDLATINQKLAETTLTFGSAHSQQAGEKLKATAGGLGAPAAADRAAYYANSMTQASYDLLYNIQKGKVKLETLKKEELPPQLQNKNLEEQKAFLNKLDQERTQLTKDALALDKKRKEFIAQKEKENSKNVARDSFDNQVLNILQTQAKRINVQYQAVPEKKK